ncbi:MAG: MalY/PatB family protein [Thermodesulfobacteriota bacterium]
MRYNFDEVITRRGTDSSKWTKYGEDVLPLWVADMDFISAEPIRQALRERAEHGIYGYTRPPKELYQVIIERLQKLYQWEVQKKEIFFLPSIVTGLNLSFHAFVRPGEGVIVQPPVYHHFIKDPPIHGRTLIDPPLVPKDNTYEIDFDAFEESITAQTKLFMLCNPHNPVGRVFTTQELERIAEICLRHRLIICADEIHGELLYPGYRHIPIANLSPEIANSTITLMSPSKTFNLPGLGCGFAIIKNSAWQQIWEKTSMGLIPHLSIMAQTAALAAFKYGQEWLNQVIEYLRQNRDFLYQYVRSKFTGIRISKIEGTYLAWLDCRQAGIPENPFDFFLRKAKVALNDGAQFGKGGKGFVRLNFACPRPILTEALERMTQALRSI